MRMRARAAAVLAALAVSVTPAVALSAPAANAGGYGCSGNLVDTYSVKSKWNTLSHVYLYYNAKTGYNCAVNVKTKYYSQFKHKISIHMYNSTWAEDNNRPGVNTDYDGGKFLKWAGPVKVKGKGLCVSIVADTYYYDEHGHAYLPHKHCR
ncbi:hypothetical protein AB0L06_42035 [Spirillospora sp. NPDC052269]